MSILDQIEALNQTDKPEPPQLKEVQNEAAPVNPQWTKYRQQFKDAMEGSFYTIEGVEKAINQGRAIFFPGVKSAVICEYQVYDGGKKIMAATWGVGDLSEIKQLIPGIEAVARLTGCQQTLIEGRAGWARELKSLGYRDFSRTVVKDL